MMANSKLIFEAIKTGSYNTVLSLLKSGADPNATDGGRSLLYQAVTQDGISGETIALLLQYGAKPDYDVLDRALPQFNVKIIKKLIQHGAEPNGHNPRLGNALHKISSSRLADRSEICELLIKHGVQVDHENECHNTPLFIAIDYKNVEIIETLLQYGARPCYYHLRGTPLIRSFGRVPTLAVETMVKYAALQVNHRDDKEMQDFFLNFGNKKLNSEQEASGKQYMAIAKECMEEIEVLKGVKLSEDGKSLFDFALSQSVAISLQSKAETLRIVLDHLPFFITYRDILVRRIDTEHILSKLENISNFVYWNYDVNVKPVIFDTLIFETIANFLSKMDVCNLYIAVALASKPGHD